MYQVRGVPDAWYQVLGTRSKVPSALLGAKSLVRCPWYQRLGAENMPQSISAGLLAKKFVLSTLCQVISTLYQVRRIKSFVADTRYQIFGTRCWVASLGYQVLGFLVLQYQVLGTCTWDEVSWYSTLYGTGR